MFVNIRYNLSFCIAVTRQFIFLCDVVVSNIDLDKSSSSKYLVPHISQRYNRCFFIAVCKRGTSGQNLLSAHLPISGDDSWMVNWKIKFHIFWLTRRCFKTYALSSNHIVLGIGPVVAQHVAHQIWLRNVIYDKKFWVIYKILPFIISYHIISYQITPHCITY